ncbi:MAG: 3-deoxy-manno-octulosonate cytidylyltransferase [Rickettsiaceae bacterium]|nr:3-deoxy-manno-octulosonate cytidylyltransferase [Rickettsiaceae bacterium]MDP4832525.1 3-deoxy-manno-octulosonate cytidylyltransferase [Rickettsiaceae bacterium]MDP5020233.1 3-deoxy-manno-octulosonate cytidylyltransferase [Rickettsiaceae bacterium]MDP5083498.1 3-deoxy-manno-octulosonate cytidylyltransferase [Rickettsiaceae bacterium]
MHSDVAIIIPSRIGSTRLPRKALAKIGELSLIEHVVRGLKDVAGNNVYVATDSEEIAALAELSGAIAIMTDEDCATGSDRVFQAFQKIPGRDKIKYIINIQGDMPFVKAAIVNKIIDGLKNGIGDIVTPVVKVDEDIALSNSNVKVVTNNLGQAMYFSRSLIPHGASEFLYHVGIYGFSRDALEHFVNLPQGECEKLEKLEQLRALEHGMKIGVCLSDDIPISVDTPGDLEKAKEYYATLIA